MLAAVSGLFAGGAVGVAEDADSGLFDRLRSLPVPRPAVLLGRSMADTALITWGTLITLIVGFIVVRMGWSFGWDAMHDLMDRSVDEQEVAAIRQTLVDTPGVKSVHDIRTRKMGDMIVVDAHIELDATLSVETGHDIAVQARSRVLQRHRVLNLMTHVDPWRRPDLDHASVVATAA